ncbi:DUF1254 domain-containing protein [Roseimicrobium sp. ORNL1]|uniref:DUF1254 domain-containing protein n=1 Tax=Roseimicrobium sp. ORNL1 TaxID=2711231 RepID=UPI0013E116D9|nr:DUF1254 domain-containing protein [Roseimicrobium sp. ORNL1]QIF05341.1 DUF1254 domain-containing protein [Roseimicrobium sp. ORNL1]
MKTHLSHLLLTLTGVMVFRCAVAQDYEFKGGYPTAETIQRAYDDADLNRAIQAYKFFYPTVSILATYEGNARAGMVENKNPMLMLGTPAQAVFTPNSDTPYAGANFDLSKGPMVVEIPPGAVMSVVNDLNQRYVMDLGLPGPDAGKGGKHLVIPPGWKGEIPQGYYAAQATTNRVLVLFRAIPTGGDMNAAIDKLKSINFYPHKGGGDADKPVWLEVGAKFYDFTPVPWEDNLEYWKKLHSVIDAEPPYEAYRMYYGELAMLGIQKGKPFAPDERMQIILEKAAKMANIQMRVQSFADRRPERIAWPDRKWEWASLRFENGTFDTPNYKDLEAREKWFYQAQIESPAMFRRDEHAGSLYWLGVRDASGVYLDGGKTYKLTVPLPVPAKLFWSVTVYDTYSRSEIVNQQGTAAIRSLQELKDLGDAKSVDLYFGPKLPAGASEKRWVQTLPTKGWFTYFRIYGPGAPAFNGAWKPGDFEEVK